MDSIKEYIDNLKIEDIPWDRMVTAYGTAEKYPEYLLVLDSMQNIDKMNEALYSLDFEHQSTLFAPAPFALVFLVRIYEKAKNKNTPEAEWLVNQLNKCFKYYLEICADADSMEHPKALENMSDILNENYLIPEGVNIFDCDEDEFEELNEKLFQENLFYSLYYYSGVVLAEVSHTEETETYRELFHLKEYSEEIIREVILSAMKSSSVPITETAKKLNISEDDVREILDRTSQVWNH